MLIAPRISPRLLDEIERLARRKLPFAEVNRRVGEAAVRLSLPQPSYEQVRTLVHEARSLRPDPSTATLTAAVLFRYPQQRHYERLRERLLEPPPTRLRERAGPTK